ncbi:carboxylesterase family protein [Microbacterium sp. GXF7504]
MTRAAIDVVARYGVRQDASDRFSELSATVPPSEETAPAAFPQRPGGLDRLLGGANGELPQHEDAFLVRVQAPEDADGLPVVVFVPGGGFLSGAGCARWFDAAGFVARHRVVLVTVTYRIGVLGMLGAGAPDPADAQRPVRDVLQALRWVRHRIGDLGGDPEQVTLAGDSAGAWIGYALATTPAAAGLFRRAALISLPWDPPLAPEVYAARAASVHDAVAADGGLAAVSAERALDAQGELARAFAGKGMPLLPAAGGDLRADLHDFAASASRLHVESLLLLSTAEEAAAFLGPAPDAAFTDAAVEGFLGARFAEPVAAAAWIAAKRAAATPKERMIEAMTLHQFRLAHLELAAAATAAGVRVSLGGFAVQSPLPGAYSPHCMPLPFLFGSRDSWDDAPMLDGLDDAVFDAVSDALGGWFADFAFGYPHAVFDPEAPLRREFDGGEVRDVAPTERWLTAVR